MHYRWSYVVEQRAWLLDEFGRFSSTAGREQRRAAAGNFMGQMEAMLPLLGITPDTGSAIEVFAPGTGAILDDDFLAHPVDLLGAVIADFGPMVVMFGHGVATLCLPS